MEQFVNDVTSELPAQPDDTGFCEFARRVPSGLPFAINHHHSHAPVGVQENDAALLKRASDLIPRALVHLEATFGLEPFEGG